MRTLTSVENEAGGSVLSQGMSSWGWKVPRGLLEFPGVRLLSLGDSSLPTLRAWSKILLWEELKVRDAPGS